MLASPSMFLERSKTVLYFHAYLRPFELTDPQYRIDIVVELRSNTELLSSKRLFRFLFTVLSRKGKTMHCLFACVQGR